MIIPRYSHFYLSNLSYAIITFIIVTVTVATVFGLDIQPVGSINSSIYAPTSLEVSSDQLAVLEPYSRELKLFSPEGMITHRISISGEVSGLTRLDDEHYLFCDHKKKRITQVNTTTGEEREYLIRSASLLNPVDILKLRNSVAILDAGNSTIVEAGLAARVIDIYDSSGTKIIFASSFVFNETNQTYYILDQLLSRIIVVDTAGNFINQFGSFGNKQGEFTRGGELAIDLDGNIYISDRFQGDISVFDADGNYLDRVRAFTESVAIPTGITIDETGLLYVASTMGLGIQIFFTPLAPTIDRQTKISHQYPPDGISLASSDIRLVGSVSLLDSAVVVTNMDFQLYNDTLQFNPELDAQDIPLQEVNSAINSIKEYTAEWIPEIDFDDGKSFFWRIRISDGQAYGKWSGFSSFSTNALPEVYRLDQNYPNPFNPSTNITYSLPSESMVRLEIFNLLGQEIRVLVNQKQTAGEYVEKWDGKDNSGKGVATGVYFYRLKGNDYTMTKKMVLVR